MGHQTEERRREKGTQRRTKKKGTGQKKVLGFYRLGKQDGRMDGKTQRCEGEGDKGKVFYVIYRD